VGSSGADVSGGFLRRAGRRRRIAGQLLTTGAIRRAIGQLRDEQASIEDLSRQLGIASKTLWRAIHPVVEAAAQD